LGGETFPLSRSQVLSATAGKTVEGWEVDYFLAKALKKPKYSDLRAVMADLEDWLEAQG
jgi:hypothetical protein